MDPIAASYRKMDEDCQIVIQKAPQCKSTGDSHYYDRLSSLGRVIEPTKRMTRNPAYESYHFNNYRSIGNNCSASAPTNNKPYEGQHRGRLPNSKTKCFCFCLISIMLTLIVCLAITAVVLQVLLWIKLGQFEQESNFHFQQLEANVSKLSNNNRSQFTFVPTSKAAVNHGCNTVTKTRECITSAKQRECSTDPINMTKQDYYTKSINCESDMSRGTQDSASLHIHEYLQTAYCTCKVTADLEPNTMLTLTCRLTILQCPLRE